MLMSVNKNSKELPKEWKFEKLRSIAQISSGGNAPQGSQYFKDGKYPFIRVKHFNGEFDYVKEWDLINDKAIKDYKLKLFPKDSIIFPKSGATIKLEKRAMLPTDAYVVNHLCIINPNKSKIDDRYLFYFLKLKRLANMGSGSTLPYLKLSQIKELSAPIPPFLEQKKISNFLYLIQTLKEQTFILIESLKDLKNSLLKHFFKYGYSKIDNQEMVILKKIDTEFYPIDWEIKRLNDVCVLRKETIQPAAAADMIYVGLEHIDSGDIYLRKWGDPKDVISTKNKFFSGDILYGKLRPYLDKVAIAQNQGICSTDILVLKVNSEIISEKFLAYFMHTQPFLNFAIKTMTGVNHPRTSWSKLKNFSIPCPSLDIQQKIIDVFYLLDKKIHLEFNKVDVIKDLFFSFLNKIYTGNLRINKIEAS